MSKKFMSALILSTILLEFTLSTLYRPKVCAGRRCFSQLYLNDMFIDILNMHIDMIISFEIAWAMLCEYITDITISISCVLDKF